MPRRCGFSKRPGRVSSASGAKLDAAGKARLAAINEELASLGARFGQNVLADEKEWVLFLDGDDLAGLPDFLTSAMAEAAESRGRKGKLRGHAVAFDLRAFHHLFGAPRPAREGFPRLCHAAARTAARPTIGEVVKKTLQLRAEKAKLVGYDSYAALKLDDTMAKTPEAVLGPARPGLGQGAREGSAGGDRVAAACRASWPAIDPIAAWDWRYYQERLRAEKFAFDEAELKPYLQLERIIEACFDVATRLFGVSFEEKKGITAWHPDVRVFEVQQRGRQHSRHFSSPTISRGRRSAPAPG